METKIDALIEKHKFESDALTRVLNHEDTKGAEKDKLLACRRFIQGFINDLILLKETKTK